MLLLSGFTHSIRSLGNINSIPPSPSVMLKEIKNIPFTECLKDVMVGSSVSKSETLALLLLWGFGSGYIYYNKIS